MSRDTADPDGQPTDPLSDEAPPTPDDPRLASAEERLAVPVVVAAIASVPAVFLTTLEGTAETAGQLLNWASMAVLTAESVILFLIARDRRRWLREHKVLIAVTVIALLAVIFAVGPGQLLRLVRFVGALRVIRVNRIVKAGRILRRRAGLHGVVRNAVAAGVTLAAAAFVAIVLADPTSDSRQFIEAVVGTVGVWPIVLAGLILAGATYVVFRYRDE